MAQLQETTVDGNVFVTGEVIETGNQPVSGTIDLASTDELPEGSSNLYFTTERAQDAAAQMLTAGVSPGTGITATYSDNVDEFEFSVDLSPFSTDDLSEGGSNLYYTQARFDTAFGNKDTDDLTEGASNLYYTDSRTRSAVSASGDLSYDSGTGTFSVTTYKSGDFDADFASKTTDDLAEGSSNLYYTEERVDDRVYNLLVGGTNISLGYDDSAGTLTIDATDTNTTYQSGTNITIDGSNNINFDGLGAFSTSDLSEGTNLYYTDTRVRSAVSASGDLNYDSGTGVFSVTTYKSTDFNTDFSTKTTDDLAEGSSNLYYTDTRVRNALSAAGDLNYNSSTGEFSVTTYKSSDFDTDFGSKTTDNLSEGTSNLYFTDARTVAAIEAATLSVLNVDNVQINGNTISTTNTDGNLFIQPNGTGIIEVNTDIVPDVDNTRTLGTPSLQWQDVYIGPGSLYVNGKKVIEDDAGTINVTTDQDQNLSIRTKGTGNLEFVTGGANIQVKANLELADGTTLNSAAGNITFDDSIEFSTGNGIDAADIITGTIPSSAIDDSSLSSISGTPNTTFAVDSDATNHVLLKNNAGELQIRNQADSDDADLVVKNLTVNGTTTTVNSETISLADNIITLNSDATGTPTEDAGIEVNRGSMTNASLIWDESTDSWKAGVTASETEIALVGDNISQFTNDSGYIVDISGFDTDDLSEGTGNLYYTDTRVRNALSAAGDLSYNVTTGEFSVTTYKSSDFDTDFGGKNTDDLTEGVSNLYFTNTRARNALSASGDLSYDSGTGTFSVTTYKSSDFDTDFGTKSTSDLSEGTNLYFTNERVDDRVSNLLSGGSNVSLSYDDTNGILTINATDTDTTYSGGTNISISGTTINFDGLGSFSTSDLSEGANLYYTAERAQDDALGNVIGGTNVTVNYDDSANTLTVNATDTNTTYSGGSNISISGTTINFDGLAAFSTSNLSEGTNLYFTQTRVSNNTDVSANTSHRGSISNPHSTSYSNLNGSPSDDITAGNELSWSGNTLNVSDNPTFTTVTTSDGLIGSNAVGDKTISTSQPSGGSDGDVWYVVS